jgi:hypothetical protein
MISLALPLALLGLGLIPIAWWLQRLGDSEAVVQVSAGFLFESAVTESGARQARKQDPISLLRITLLTLMILALTEPSWDDTSSRRITIWLDNSLSMQAVDDQPRLALAVRTIQNAITETDDAAITIRFLSEHGELREFSADNLNAQLMKLEPAPPHLPLVLASDSDHWLVTDGADDRLNAWSEQLTRTLVVGTAVQNVALSNLSARRSLQSRDHLTGSVRLDNFSVDASDTRVLTIIADGNSVFTTDPQKISPGTNWLHFNIPAATSQVTARLSSGDALSLDDELILELATLDPVDVLLDSQCGGNLSAALRANQGLRTTDSAKNADVIVSCPEMLAHPNKTIDASLTPELSIVSDDRYVPVRNELRWHLNNSLSERKNMNLPLASGWLKTGFHGPPVTKQTLLSSPDMNLSLLELQPRGTSTTLDLETASIVARPEYPLLINALIEATLNRAILDPIAAVSRSVDESRIQRRINSRDENSALAASTASIDLAPYLLFVALGLLMVDLSRTVVLRFNRARV